MGSCCCIKYDKYFSAAGLKELAVAGGALIFVNMILPLLDSLTSMAISAVNKTVNKWSLDMELDKREAEAAAETIAPTGSITQAIGFQIPNESYDDEYYEDKKIDGKRLGHK